MIADLKARPNVTLLQRTTAFGYFPHNLIGLNERVTEHLSAPHQNLPRERLWQVRATEVVLATGAIERPLVFPGNDRPGIMLASAARTYLNRYGVRVGKRAVIVAGCDAAYAAALDLKAAGITIAAICDVRPSADGPAATRARAAGLAITTNTTILGTRGRLRIQSVRLGHLEISGSIRPGVTVACDTVLMSGGYTPTVHLYSQSRGKLRFDSTSHVFVPGTSEERERSAGACKGIDGLHAVLADGAAQGLSAAAATGFAGSPRRYTVVATETSGIGIPGALPQPGKTPPAKAFVAPMSAW